MCTRIPPPPHTMRPIVLSRKKNQERRRKEKRSIKHMRMTLIPLQQMCRDHGNHVQQKMEEQVVCDACMHACACMVCAHREGWMNIARPLQPFKKCGRRTRKHYLKQERNKEKGCQQEFAEKQLKRVMTYPRKKKQARVPETGTPPPPPFIF